MGDSQATYSGTGTDAHEPEGGTPLARPSRRAQRYSMDPANRGAVVGNAVKVSTVRDVPPAVHQVDRAGRARQDLAGAPVPLTGRGQSGLERSIHRRHPRRRKKRGLDVGRTRRGKATKIMAVVDRHGLPIAIGIACGQRHETKLVRRTLQQRFLKELPKRLIGDRAYDSNGLDADLALDGIEMIAPHNPRHTTKTQDGRSLRRYRRRWKIERFFAWLNHFRRLVTRWEYKSVIFLGLLKLACAVILLRGL